MAILRKTLKGEQIGFKYKYKDRYKDSSRYEKHSPPAPQTPKKRLYPTRPKTRPGLVTPRPGGVPPQPQTPKRPAPRQTGPRLTGSTGRIKSAVSRRKKIVTHY